MTDNNEQSLILVSKHASLIKGVVGKIYELGLTAEFVAPLIEGPRLVYFGLRPTGSTKVNRLEDVAGDLAVSLRVESVLVKRMPGQGVVGVFIPRSDPQVVRWMDLLGSADKQAAKEINVPLLLGITWQGDTYMQDLTQCPHLLVAGSTGGGKSVLMRSLIATIVQSRQPSEVQLVLSDTKGVEFTDFDKAPHLRWPRATTPLQTIEYMDQLVDEVDTRLTLFGAVDCKNIAEWNQRLASTSTLSERKPYIVLVIDELADIVDLPNAKGKAAKIGSDKLDYITRKARAAGIHVVAGVQRPSVDVVKGVIKNNFPARLSFKMPSQVDSRVVIDTEGAEHLLGVGDCLYKGPNVPGLVRLHTGYATTSDIKAVLEYVSFRQSYGLNNSNAGKELQ